MASTGNTRLLAARRGLGLRSQAALAKAVTEKATELNLRVSVTERTVRRWESANPPWPDSDRAAALEALFSCRITDLGFTPPWADTTSATSEHSPTPPPVTATTRYAPLGRSGLTLPASTATDYAAATVSYRHLYWHLPAATLYPVASAHAHMGVSLIDHSHGPARANLAAAVSESNLLAGRLAFFDLDLGNDTAHRSFVLALHSAHEADDNLLGAAALAHMAFAPAFADGGVGAEEARDRLRAARAFARRGTTSTTVLAWIDAVEAEVETKFGETRAALNLLRHAEQLLADEDPQRPVWLDWFSSARLAGFTGGTLIATGRSRQAREALAAALSELPDSEAKQRSVVLADLAATAVIDKDPDQACHYLSEALDQLAVSWYSTGMNRIKHVRQSLREWDSLPCVRALDERLYDWHTTVTSIMG